MVCFSDNIVCFCWKFISQKRNTKKKSKTCYNNRNACQEIEQSEKVCNLTLQAKLNLRKRTCVETQVFETSSSFIYTALVSRIFLDVFSCYNLKMSQRSECTIAHSGLWDIFILHLYCFGFTNFSRCLFLLQFCTVVTCNKKRHLEKFVKPKQYLWRCPKDQKVQVVTRKDI